METEKLAPEGMFARGWNDTKRIFHDWRFWAVEVIGGTIAGVFHPLLALAFVAGIVLAVYTALTVRAPAIQRQERIECLEQVFSPRSIEITITQPPTVKRIAGGGGKRLVTFEHVVVKSEDTAPTLIALRLLVEGWDESYMVPWEPSGLWIRGGPKNLPKVIELNPGETKSGQLQFRIPFGPSLESKLHCRLIAVRPSAERTLEVYALDHKEDPLPGDERIEIAVERDELTGVSLVPLFSKLGERTGTYVDAYFSAVRITNNDNDYITVAIGLEISDPPPQATSKLFNTTEIHPTDFKIERRDYKEFTLRFRRLYHGVIANEEASERIRLCVKATGVGTFRHKLEPWMFYIVALPDDNDTEAEGYVD